MKAFFSILVMMMTFSLIAGSDIASLEEEIHQVFEQMKPRMVSIEVETKEPVRVNLFTVTREKSGCGVLLEDGLIVTNYHISDEDNVKSIKVRFYGSEKKYDAGLVGTDEMNDLALIRVNEHPGTDAPLKWADMENVRVGQFIVALGDPFGLDQTVTFGIISKVQRDLESRELNPYIQSDIVINPGNSGGPLVNLKGEIIGINARKHSDYAFSIPADIVQESIEKMKAGTIPQPFLGLRFSELDESHRTFLDENDLNGVLFDYYLYQSPAIGCGMVSGDIITEVNGQPIEGRLEMAETCFRRMVNKLDVGSTATLTFWRFGEEIEVEVPVIDTPEDEEPEEFECENWGIEARSITGQTIYYKGESPYVHAGHPMLYNLDSDAVVGPDVQEGWAITGIVVDNDVVDIDSIEDLKDIYEAHEDDPLVYIRLSDGDDNYFRLFRNLEMEEEE